MARLSFSCPQDCPDACRLVAEVEDGRIARVTGDPRHPVTRGFACAKTIRYPERLYDPRRPLHPMRRLGAKGEGRFARISWKEALDEIADHLKATLSTHGGEAVLRYNYAGTMGLVEGRAPVAFFRAIGASELDETICSATGEAAWAAIYGERKLGVDPEDLPKAKTIVLWGANVLSTNTHLVPLLKAARKNGAKIFAIDVYENKTARFADHFLKLRPGTDAALALGLTRALKRMGALDTSYIERYTEGAKDLLEAAAAWDPARVAATTGVTKEDLLALAQDLATRRPALFRVGYGMTRHAGGGHALAAVLMLPVLLGSWQEEGGGALLSTSGGFALNKRRLEGLHFWRGHAPKGYFRPNPYARHVNQIQIGRALLDLNDPPVKMLFVFNANPAASAPNAGAVRRGLAREDLFTVVLENQDSDTARFADLLLSVTHPLEHADLYTSYGHYHLSWSEPVAPAPGEARPNTWVFQELARRLGLKAPTLYFDAERWARELLDSADPWLRSIDFEKLKSAGSLKLDLPRPFLPYAQGRPDGKKLHLFAPRVRAFSPPEGKPYRLLTPPAHHLLNTSFNRVAALLRAEGGEPLVLVHPDDAEREGLEDNDLVLLENERGRLRRRVRLSDRTQPGVLVMEGVWDAATSPDGQPNNLLTPDEPTDMGEGSSFQETWVALRRMDA